MATKHDLVDWLYDALQALGGRARIASLCEHIWDKHEDDLRASGDLFFTWQYDIRWAAHKLRKQGKMKPTKNSPKGVWELAG